MFENNPTDQLSGLNKTERIANKNKTVALIASFVFPPLGYWLLGKRKYGVLCLFTLFYFFTGFLVVPVHTRILINRARKVRDGKVEQKSYHRHYGECPRCGDQLLRFCGPTSVVCESCGSRHSMDEVDRNGILPSPISTESDEHDLDFFEVEDSDLPNRVDELENNPSTGTNDSVDVSERAERIEGETKPVYGIGAGLSLIAFGSLISITGIGAIIGIPMVAIGLVFVIVGAVGQTGKTAKKSMTESVWKDTALEETTPGVVRHRKATKKFGGRCASCGEFASLRDRGESGIVDDIQCSKCGCRFEREGSDGWRLIEGGRRPNRRAKENQGMEKRASRA